MHKVHRSSQIVLERSKRYGLYINRLRAIPERGDGLKDGQRKALHVMRSKGRIKTISLAGAMIEQGLYLHGDVSAADACCTMAAPFSNNLPLLKGLGTFGTRTAPNAYGAPRYTEVEKPSYLAQLLYTDHEVCPMADSYDGSHRYPSVFLPLLPLLLINGAQGIGLGWASTVLPRDPKVVAAAVIAALEGTKMPKMPPWVAWSGCPVESRGYSKAGGPSWTFTGIVDVKDTSTAVVTDIPYGMTSEELNQRLDAMVEAETIQDYEDASSDEIKVTVKYKRGSIKDMTPDDVADQLKLRSLVTENLVVVVDDNIRHYGWDEKAKVDPVHAYVQDWVEWRLGFYELRYQRLKGIAEEELAYQRAIKACIDGKFPAWLPSAKDRPEVVAKVASLAPWSNDDQRSRIANMPSHRWARDAIGECVAKIKLLEEEIRQCALLLKKPELRREKFAEEVRDLAKGLPTLMREVATWRE